METTIEQPATEQPAKTIASGLTEGRTKIEKGAYHGWSGETIFKGENGNAWIVSTHKGNNNKLHTSAQEVKLENKNGYTTMSFELFGSRTKTVLRADAQEVVNQKKITAFHAKGLEAFRLLTDADFKKG